MIPDKLSRNSTHDAQFKYRRWVGGNVTISDSIGLDHSTHAPLNLPTIPLIYYPTISLSALLREKEKAQSHYHIKETTGTSKSTSQGSKITRSRNQGKDSKIEKEGTTPQPKAKQHHYKHPSSVNSSTTHFTHQKNKRRRMIKMKKEENEDSE